MATDDAGTGNKVLAQGDINEAETIWDDVGFVSAKLPNDSSEGDINEAETVFEGHGVTEVTTDPEAGQSLDAKGRFRILQKLGAGGMGSVYLCEDTKLGRRVAVKKPRKSTAANAALFSALVREAQSLARLTHPNIVDIKELTDDPEDSVIVMEYLEDGSLADRLERTGPLNLDRARVILKQVSKGLQYAHELGVIHRDVKPSNILFTRDETPKLSDFGLALPAPSQPEFKGAPSGGSPAYMAPEQRSGIGNLDQRADVYGLGATLYQMLVGEPPGQTERAPVPASLRDFLARALAPDPSDRITSVGAFMDELSNLVDLPGSARANAIPRSDDDDVPQVWITSIDQVLTFRDIVSPIADVDFFIDLHASDERYDEADIASVIKGANYGKEVAKSEELKSRSAGELKTLKKQSKQIKRHVAGLEFSAKLNNPGIPPTKPVFGSSDSAAEQAIFQQRLDSYRLAQRKHAAIQGEIEDAKQQSKVATCLYDQKSRDFEELIRQQENQVYSALDLDILVFLTEIKRRADRSINYDGNYFEGFVLVYFAKRAYLLLREYITGTDAKYKAIDIHDKLEDDFTSRVFAQEKSVREGLVLAARCCLEETLMREDRLAIDSLLGKIPAQECADYLSQADNLLTQSIELDFPFDPEAAVDPTKENALREHLDVRDREVGELSASVIDLIRAIEPVANALASTQSGCEDVLTNMIRKEQEERQRQRDLLFVLSVFNEKDNDQLLMKYSRWLKGVEEHINKEYDMQVQDLVSGAVTKKVAVQDVAELVKDSGRWQLLECPGKLANHKSELAASLQRLREKTEFAFALSNMRGAQEESSSDTNKKLKRSVYRKLISDGLQAGWSKEETARAIAPYVPRSLVFPVLAAGSTFGLLAAGLAIFFFNNEGRWFRLPLITQEPRVVVPQNQQTGTANPTRLGIPRKEPNVARRDDGNESLLAQVSDDLREPEQILGPKEQKNEGNNAAVLDALSSHGAHSTPERYSRGRHGRIPYSTPIPEAKGKKESHPKDATGEGSRQFGNTRIEVIPSAPLVQKPLLDPVSGDPESEELLQLTENQIAQIQRWLKASGHDPGPDDGDLGPKSRDMIRSYQSTFGGTATGFVNEALIVALESESQLGLNRQQRTQTQNWLNDTGHNLGKADGIFGLRTRQAIRSFRRSHGGEAVGYLDKDMFTALRSAAEAATRN